MKLKMFDVNEDVHIIKHDYKSALSVLYELQFFSPKDVFMYFSKSERKFPFPAAGDRNTRHFLFLNFYS